MISNITHNTRMINYSVKPIEISRSFNNNNIMISHVNGMKKHVKQQHSFENHTKVLCSLNQSMFDPMKFSPPNNFIENLKTRMNIYDDSIKKSDNIDIE